MSFEPGDDIIVEWDGVEFPGEYVGIGPSGFVTAVITVHDPELDVASEPHNLVPQPTVCVREQHVRRAERVAGSVE